MEHNHRLTVASKKKKKEEESEQPPNLLRKHRFFRARSIQPLAVQVRRLLNLELHDQVAAWPRRRQLGEGALQPSG